MAVGTSNLHHAVCFHVPEERRADFLDASVRQTLPAWRALATDGIIETRTVYETNAKVREDDLPAWQFLALSKLGNGVTTEAFSAAFGDLPAESFTTIKRAEILKPTANSFHPGPSSTAAVYSIEYIRVFDGYLDRYQDMMESRTGPAVGGLVRDGDVHSFLTFDTVAVLDSDDDIPDWTAIHVLGLDSTTRWDNFPQALDPHLRAIDPDVGFDDVFGPLPNIRAMERQVYAHRVEPLSIGY